MTTSDSLIPLPDRVNEKAEAMLAALRTIASGKGNYGRDIEEPEEYRAIAQQTLKKIGCL